jgi:hypothetical protein
MLIPALPEQHGCHFPRLRNRMVERPHQFLVVENRLGFRKWCSTPVTDGGIDKILCPTVGTELHERHSSLPFKCMHMKKGFYETTCRVVEAINPCGYLSSELHRLELFLYLV